MKANPGGPIAGDAIIGRDAEIADLWSTLELLSVVLSAERRTGKTCILRKMSEHPPDSWLPMLVFVESARHPMDCVERIYSVADELGARTRRSVWKGRFRKAYNALAKASNVGGNPLVLPQIRLDWKRWFRLLIDDIVQNADQRAIVILDEFPLMIWNIADDHGPQLAMETLDALREIRETYEPSGRFRFIFSGSIGLHLVLHHLKLHHGYKGSPTNNACRKTLSGMSPEDTELMCSKYLDDENIRRRAPAAFSRRLFERTDGLPLYIQYVCREFQLRQPEEVGVEDIDPVLRDMMDDREVQWFKDAADRIETYYAKSGAQDRAQAILKVLCDHEDYLPESRIMDRVREQIAVEKDEALRSTLELLLDDHYLVRDTSQGERRYRFRYMLLRTWWKINRG